MILVDSSTWIDFFRGASNPASDALDMLLGSEPVAVGDLILTEVLQGFTDDGQIREAAELLTSLTVIALGGQHTALQAAEHYRFLRRKGITVRRTIDVIIATRCIESGLMLLHNDCDFGPFVEHLGLRSVL